MSPTTSFSIGMEMVSLLSRYTETVYSAMFYWSSSSLFWHLNATRDSKMQTKTKVTRIVAPESQPVPVSVLSCHSIIIDRRLEASITFRMLSFNLVYIKSKKLFVTLVGYSFFPYLYSRNSISAGWP